jgi:LemA protein
LISRERANLACLMASGDPSNPDAVDELNGAESELRGALRHLMAVVEYLPGLKARRRVTRMVEEFGGLETCIANASHVYNLIANEFNRINEKWPFMLVSRLLGFKRAEAFWAGRAPARSEPAPAAADAKPKIMARRSPAAKDRCGIPAATAS